jgi:predicted ribosome quality control (RQC) complex YloA/Tae2 family protein
MVASYNMELSGLELRYLVNESGIKLGRGYYVSDVIGVTHGAILLKFRHSIEPDILLMISTQGLWITSTKFKMVEQNKMVAVLKRELERSKFGSLEQMGSERIYILKFKKNDEAALTLIVEIFGGGNMILCDSEMTILGILKSIEVRHRALRVGSKYTPPPKRGEDVFNLSLEHLMSSKDTIEYKSATVARWIGTLTSMPRRFVEEALTRARISTEGLVSQLKNVEVQSIYTSIMKMVTEVTTGLNHAPAIRLNEAGKPIDAFPIQIYNIDNPSIKRVPTFMEAIDEVLGAQIFDLARTQKISSLEQQLAVLEHDLDQQEKAKNEVILKGNSMRNLAKDIMGISQQTSDDIDFQLQNVLQKHNVKLVSEKGKKYIMITDQFILAENNLPKLASHIFTRAKELEHGTTTIEQAGQKIRSRIVELRNKTLRKENKVEFRKQQSKEWYERYHWCYTSDSLLLVGGKDASSNSAIVRKHMTESDIVFHAEIHGSPFFVLKDAKDKLDLTDSITQSAQATVSFSRAWKEGLSVADAYWVLPGQVKKGAPTGQYLPKGSFVLEGKRNFVRNVELKLAIGITSLSNDNYTMICGPHGAIISKSFAYITLVPGGLDIVSTAKKIKSEFVRLFSSSQESLISYIKQFTLDDVIRVLPTGSFKIMAVKKADSFPELQKEPQL